MSYNKTDKAWACYTTEKVNNSLSVERDMNYLYIESNYSILFQASVFVF